MGAWTTGLLGAGLVVVLLGVPAPATAQSSELAPVRAALNEARFPEARDLLERWWEADGERAERRTRQEALWLRARLTPDPQMAELDYRRLVIEFPGGPFSDGALLRLAQGAEARGDSADAHRYLEILVRDYPTSEYRVEARDRMVRLEAVGERAVADEPPVATDPPLVPDPVDDEPPVLAPPTVIQDDTVAVPDSVRRDPPELLEELTEEPEEDPVFESEERAELSGAYTVQLGAFSTRERAGELAARADEAGLEVRVVQVEGSSLFRVRMGGFESREEAERAAQDPRDRGFEALVSSDREGEHPVDR